MAFAEASFFPIPPGVLLIPLALGRRQHALELRVVALDGGHGVVHELPDGRLLSLVLQVVPARRWRDPEDVLGPVFVRILGSAPLSFSAVRRACTSSKASEMYLRKIGLRTTC